MRMRIKNLAAIVLMAALVGTASAENLLINGNFEDPDGAGWTQWWGGNSNRYVDDPVEEDHCAGVWWHDDGIFQSVAVGPGMYEFGGKIMTTEGMVNRRGVIQAEIGDGVSVWWTQQLDLVPGDAPNVWHIASPQAGFPNSAVIDNTEAGATEITINLMMINEGSPPSGIVQYDDVYLGPLGISDQAKFPVPADGASIPPVTDVLSWSNPEPNFAGDSIACDVYLATDDPNQLALIAEGVTAGSVTLSALTVPIALQEGTTYYWRVDCTDPRGGPSGTPETTEGPVWAFTTSDDNPPTVEAGTDRYIWLDMNDGDGDPAKVTFTLFGQVSDDGASPLETAWSLNYSEQDPATVIDIADPAAAETTVTIDGTGLFEFLLEADDAFAHAEDTVTVIVYGSACEAAYGDPGDISATYPNGHGDIDGDCDTDLDDFALMTISWLDCMSDKLGCAP